MLSCVNDVTDWECLTEHHTDVALCEWCHRMGMFNRASHWCWAVRLVSQNDTRGVPEGQHGSVAGQQVVPSLEWQLCGTSSCCKGLVFCCCFGGLLGFSCVLVFLIVFFFFFLLIVYAWFPCCSSLLITARSHNASGPHYGSLLFQMTCVCVCVRVHVCVHMCMHVCVCACVCVCVSLSVSVSLCLSPPWNFGICIRQTERHTRTSSRL